MERKKALKELEHIERALGVWHGRWYWEVKQERPDAAQAIWGGSLLLAKGAIELIRAQESTDAFANTNPQEGAKVKTIPGITPGECLDVRRTLDDILSYVERCADVCVEPRANENTKDFIDRCMGDHNLLSKFPDAEHRRTLCEAQWNKKTRDDAPTNPQEDRGQA